MPNDVASFRSKLLETINECAPVYPHKDDNLKLIKLQKMKKTNTILNNHCTSVKEITKREKIDIKKMRENLRKSREEEKTLNEFHRQLADFFNDRSTVCKMINVKADFELKCQILENVKLKTTKIRKLYEQVLMKQNKLVEDYQKQRRKHLKFVEVTEQTFSYLAKEQNHLRKHSDELHSKYSKLPLENSLSKLEKKALLQKLQFFKSKVVNAKKLEEENLDELQRAYDEKKTLKQQLQKMRDAKVDEDFYRKRALELSNNIVKYDNRICLMKRQYRIAKAHLQQLELGFKELLNDEFYNSESFKVQSKNPRLSTPNFMKNPSTGKPSNAFAPIPRRRTSPRRSLKNSAKPDSRSESLSCLN